MTLDRLVEEVRARARAEVDEEQKRLADAARTAVEEREAELRRIASEGERAVALETAKIRSAEVAKARVEGRKRLFAARQRAAERTIADVRKRLGEYAESDEYAALLRRLYDHAIQRLGKPVRLLGRAEDAPLLKGLQGRGSAPGVVPILGGLIAETGDGSRRLDLSFDELLRRREEALLALGQSAGARG